MKAFVMVLWLLAAVLAGLSMQQWLYIKGMSQAAQVAGNGAVALIVTGLGIRMTWR